MLVKTLKLLDIESSQNTWILNIQVSQNTKITEYSIHAVQL